MGQSTNVDPLEIVVHDDTVILTGLGNHHLLLTAKAAEKLAYRLSGAAFAASAWTSAAFPVELGDAEWRVSKQPPRASKAPVQRSTRQRRSIHDRA